MRERLDANLSATFQEKILLPETLRDYDLNFEEMILLNKAYALMLKKIGVITTEECKDIINAQQYVYETLKREDLSGNCEDLYFNIEQAMIARIGIETGGKLHTGRSRNDLYSCLTRMEVRRATWKIVGCLTELQNILVKEAQDNTETVITGYTHNQPGQPITLAHYYTAACYALTRDFDRIVSAYKNTNRSPYGAAAFAGATFPIDRNYLCRLCGFDSSIENSIDSIASKDFIVEMEMAFTIMMTNISRFATDMYFWASDECGILDLGGEVAICSSIMPQKKNPVCFEYARSKVAHVTGGMISALMALKNVPFTNNTDIFETPVMFDDTVEQTLQGLEIFIECIKYSKINKNRALDMAKNNYSTVTGLADYLVKNAELSFEEAHAIVGKIIGEIIDNNDTIKNITGEVIKVTAKELTGKDIVFADEEINGVLDPWNNIQSKKTFGSPNKEHVNIMIDNLKEKIVVEKKWLEKEKRKVREAYEKLNAEIDNL